VWTASVRWCFACRGGQAAEDLSRQLGVPLYKLEHWRQKAEAALDGALKERETNAMTGEPSAPVSGVALTYVGFSVGGLVQDGRYNSQWSLAPQGAFDALVPVGHPLHRRRRVAGRVRSSRHSSRSPVPPR
jgi:hypothetical protein